MKTAEETLSAILDSADKEEQDIEKIKAYGRQCAEQALKDAADVATMTFHDGQFKTNNPTKYHQMGADNLQVNRESILSTPILTP